MKIHWSDIDWSLTNAEIADLTSRALGTVRNRRSQFASGSASAALRSNALDWAAVDWSASDEQIAATHGRALRTVQLNRLNQNPNPRQIPQAAAWEGIDWSLTSVQIPQAPR